MLKEFYETGEFPYKGRPNIDRMASETMNDSILILLPNYLAPSLLKFFD